MSAYRLDSWTSLFRLQKTQENEPYFQDGLLEGFLTAVQSLLPKGDVKLPKTCWQHLFVDTSA